MQSSTEPKDRTLNIRASTRLIERIDQAAALRNQSRTNFMLDAAAKEADDVIFESNVFSMPADEWDRYIETIMSPPAPTEGLRKLLREPAPWDE